jgi:hypothetical protein
LEFGFWVSLEMVVLDLWYWVFDDGAWDELGELGRFSLVCLIESYCCLSRLWHWVLMMELGMILVDR